MSTTGMWRSTVVAAVTASSLAFGGSAVSAAQQADVEYRCYGCHVVAAGPAADAGKVLVQLDDPEGKLKTTWFEATKAPDQVLQTALAALTSGKTVTAFVASLDPNSAINRIYLERYPKSGSN
ncbi:hypothetical protein [Actinoplanes xinjiangensis]|uniref:Cytochrome c domain-containing protein n=1 Tax=Actinoplanes xinjiangensis TaxID=512350 RepID=A0A316FDL6_9ACTN|nr:hypothetical protein [Actinoplanes xinjiangensis]PWK46964.1 hypothetical protein BC793_10878 [Actinoplanes xinjiangensis]GIF40122.1 hypothetical protein Axi01nite_44330 [Actinoplanes xinjiangensis]